MYFAKMIASKKLGIVITSICLLIIVLLFFLGIQYQAEQKTMCENACGEGNNCTMDSCPYHQQNDTLFVIGIISTLAAFIGGIGIYLTLKTQEKLLEEKEFDLTALSDEEKNMFLFIKEHREGVYQSSLLEKFNISKVQTTRILDSLEQQGLIERKRRGMTNLVILK